MVVGELLFCPFLKSLPKRAHTLAFAMRYKETIMAIKIDKFSAYAIHLKNLYDE